MLPKAVRHDAPPGTMQWRLLNDQQANLIVMPANTRTNTRAARWARLPDAELLQLRFCDLDLQVAGTRVERGVRRLYRELHARDVPFEPHIWLADEWFSPDGVPGIAVPFYLVHPRLERLQRRMESEVEGGNARWLMRILRHEAGHAVDTAYRLRRRARWRQVFGPASLPYPERYRARPGSRRYVQHLGNWYAQAHPTEDFAETFAVWLTPRSTWRHSYADWPALDKLTVVQEFMSEIAGQQPPVRNRERIEPLEENTRTLSQHYQARVAQRREQRSVTTDALLTKAFTTERPRKNAPRASAFLREVRLVLLSSVERDLAADRYSVQQHLRLMIARCMHHQFYLRGSRRDALRNARWILGHLTRLYASIESPTLAL